MQSSVASARNCSHEPCVPEESRSSPYRLAPGPPHILVTQGAGDIGQQVEGADCRFTKPQWNRMDRGETLLPRAVPKTLARGRAVLHVRQGERESGGGALHARARPSAQLHDFHEPAGLAGRGDNLELTVFVGQENACRRDVEQTGATLHQFL